MQLPRHIFREYDIRGVVETDLTPEVVVALGRGLGTMFAREGLTRVAVGRDVRPSGERLFDDLQRGLRSAGCDVVDVGPVPTPVLYHACATGDEQAGVMITGSHNPPEFNGFKVVWRGRSFFGDHIRALADLMEAGEFARGEGSLSARDAIGPYVADCASRVEIPRKVRFAYDPGNGAAALVCKRLFAAVGQEPVALFDEPDGSFPNHHPDPTVPENLVDLTRTVQEQSLELGVSYDGDADRIGVIDEQGDVLWGDRLLILYARELLRKQPGAGVIFDVKCSQALADAVAAAGGEPIIWKTGHSLIKEKMKETGAPLAGEMSGHMFFADGYHGYDDALFATLRLLELVARDEQPLSTRLADVPELVATPELRIDCPDEHKFAVVDHILAHFRATHEVVDIDGARVVFPQGWGLVRASNTQPALVMRVEADDEASLGAYREQMEGAVAAARAAVGADG